MSTIHGPGHTWQETGAAYTVSQLQESADAIREVVGESRTVSPSIRVLLAYTDRLEGRLRYVLGDLEGVNNDDDHRGSLIAALRELAEKAKDGEPPSEAILSIFANTLERVAACIRLGGWS